MESQLRLGGLTPILTVVDERRRPPRTTRWGERYMAGQERRAFLPDPDELRRRYGENATAAASVMGSLRPAMLAVMAVMSVIFIVVVVAALAGGKPASTFPGWAVAVLALDVAGACVALTVITMQKAKKMASLRPDRL